MNVRWLFCATSLACSDPGKASLGRLVRGVGEGRGKMEWGGGERAREWPRLGREVGPLSRT